MTPTEKKQLVYLLGVLEDSLESSRQEVEEKSSAYYVKHDGDQCDYLEEDNYIFSTVLQRVELILDDLQRAKKGFILGCNRTHKTNRLKGKK